MATEKAMAIGGLSSNQLAEATASESHILSGQTFYSGDKELKTGTMKNNGAMVYDMSVNMSYNIPEGYHNGDGRIYQNEVPIMSTKTHGVQKSVQTIVPTGTYAYKQIIAPVTQTGLAAENIVKGVNVRIYSSSNTLWDVTGTAEIVTGDLSQNNIQIGTYHSTPTLRKSAATTVSFNLPIGRYVICGFYTYGTSYSSQTMSTLSTSNFSSSVANAYTCHSPGGGYLVGWFDVSADTTITVSRASWPFAASTQYHRVSVIVYKIPS